MLSMLPAPLYTADAGIAIAAGVTNAGVAGGAAAGRVAGSAFGAAAALSLAGAGVEVFPSPPLLSIFSYVLSIIT